MICIVSMRSEQNHITFVDIQRAQKKNSAPEMHRTLLSSRHAKNLVKTSCLQGRRAAVCFSIAAMKRNQKNLGRYPHASPTVSKPSVKNMSLQSLNTSEKKRECVRERERELRKIHRRDTVLTQKRENTPPNATQSHLQMVKQVRTNFRSSEGLSELVCNTQVSESLRHCRFADEYAIDPCHFHELRVAGFPP